jgi:hypothetical protein
MLSREKVTSRVLFAYADETLIEYLRKRHFAKREYQCLELAKREQVESLPIRPYYVALMIAIAQERYEDVRNGIVQLNGPPDDPSIKVWRLLIHVYLMLNRKLGSSLCSFA